MRARADANLRGNFIDNRLLRGFEIVQCTVHRAFVVTVDHTGQG